MGRFTLAGSTAQEEQMYWTKQHWHPNLQKCFTLEYLTSDSVDQTQNISMQSIHLAQGVALLLQPHLKGIDAHDQIKAQ